MRWLAIFICLMTGCGAVASTLTCSMMPSDSSARRCASDAAAEREGDDRDQARQEREDLRTNDDQIAERDRYRAARTPCSEGDPRACYTVALYEDGHGANDAAVEPRYRLACAGGVPHACFFAGEHEANVNDKLASYERGCALRDPEACLAGWHMDHRRRDLLAAACREDFRDSCRRLRS